MSAQEPLRKCLINSLIFSRQSVRLPGKLFFHIIFLQNFSHSVQMVYIFRIHNYTGYKVRTPSEPSRCIQEQA